MITARAQPEPHPRQHDYQQKVNQARPDRQTRDPAPAQTKSVQGIRGQASPGDDQGLKRREREKILTSP
jgi:hypothetical protein